MMLARSLSRLSGFGLKSASTTKPLLYCHNAKFQFSSSASAGSAIANSATAAAANNVSAAATEIPLESVTQVIPDVASITAAAAKSIRIEDMSMFSNAYLGDNDVSNILESVKPLGSPVAHDFIDKLSAISPSSLYTHLDEFSRDALLYLSNDLGWGMGVSIIAISLGIKFAFMPLMLGTQINALKLQLLEPEQKNYQAQLSRLQKQGDMNGVRDAQRQFFALQKRHGIRNWIALLSMVQIPVLITWFISLRYVTSMPDKFPQLRTDGMLWFQDLAEQDPYCILPIISAFISFCNLSMSTAQGGMAQNAFFQKYRKYVKFTPILSLPIIIFFPAALNLYWAISAATHLIVPLLLRNVKARSWIGIPKYLPGTILDRLNQDKAQKIVKAVISDNKIGSSIAADAAAISSTAAKAAAQQATTAAADQTVKITSGAAKQVFMNKPPTSNAASAAAAASTASTQTVSSSAAKQVFSNKPSKKK